MTPRRRVGRYQIIRELGRGGMGTVYAALDADLGRQVALKMLDASVSHDSERLRRFEREARMLAALSHPNIVTVFSVERDGDEPFLTMELVDGQPLDQLIAEPGLEVTRFFEIAQPICEAVSAAHEQGILHRDLKPQNVILGSRGGLKLLDFGLARATTVGDATRTVEALTVDGQILGTVPYMSPEQASGQTSDQRSDQWSLGVIFFELLTGRRPFSGETPIAVLRAIIDDEAPGLRTRRPDLPRALEAIVGRCLRKAPASRYPSVTALLADIRRAREGGVSASGASAATGDDGRETSMAVLPFESMGTADAATFADGLHSDLLTRLANVAALRVISRTSVRGYRDTTKSIAEVAAELGVQWVVEGEVRQAGESVQVNARLVDATRDQQVWAHSFGDRLDAESVFQIQAEMAERIAAGLQLRVTPEERLRLRRAPTHDLDAFRLYSKGRRQLELRTADSLRHAYASFFDATRVDPDYALAWSGVADALTLLEWYGVGRPDDSPDPIAAARRSLELEPKLGEGFVSLGIRQSIARDGPAALRNLRHAVTLAPGYGEGQIWLAWLLLCLGRHEEAVGPARLAVELDPMAPAHRAYLAEILIANGRYDDAVTEARRARELERQFGIANFVEGIALHHSGRPDEAAARFEHMLTMTDSGSKPSREEVLATLAVALVTAGDSARAGQYGGRIDAERHPFAAGLFQAALGHADRAIDCFLRIRDWGAFAVDILRGMYDRELAAVRASPRHAEVIRLMNEAWGLAADGSVREEPA